MSYANTWNASDQIPLRLVEGGALSRFGQVDSTLGGASERHSLSANWQQRAARWSTGGALYAVRSALDLYSNLTSALDDPSGGDQFNQRERRTTLGGEAWARRLLDERHVWTGGVQVRRDVIDPIGLYRTQGRVRTGIVREDVVRQGSVGLWTDVESRWTPWLRTTLGARGEELGLRVARGDWRVTAAVWRLRLDSELLFIGDGGTTEAVDGSRRSGLTVTTFWRPTDRLALDADVSFARARFVDVPADAAYIPGALERVIAAGITWGGNDRGPYAAVRLRHFGAYPLIEDNGVRAAPATLGNLNLGWQFDRWRLQASVLNVSNAPVRDIQYFYASRLAGEPAGGVNDLHFHPAEPRQARLSWRWGF
jgi:hypothetical protein